MEKPSKIVGEKKVDIGLLLLVLSGKGFQTHTQRFRKTFLKARFFYSHQGLIFHRLEKGTKLNRYSLVVHLVLKFDFVNDL
ncbi:MAG: hypothetical protein KTR26_18310 [Flammeovirgaceae bacterium]|nr:hypothetical protein [Flammeovirgaceae bacterium]